MSCFLKTVFLSLVHGVLEFLPVSSSTHLNFFKRVLGVQAESLDLFLGVGSALAVLFVYRKRVFSLFNDCLRGKRPAWLYVVEIVMACIPVTLVYLFCRARIDRLVAAHPFLTGLFMMAMGVILISTRWAGRGTTGKMPFWKSLCVGVAQGFALLPGMSRSGLTISTARWLGIAMEDAVAFSFLLSVPIAFGAMIVNYREALNGQWPCAALLFACAISAVVGVFALKFLQKVAQKGKFWLFGVYCLLAGAGCTAYMCLC